MYDELTDKNLRGATLYKCIYGHVFSGIVILMSNDYLG